jgi:hypothetical protein
MSRTNELSYFRSAVEWPEMLPEFEEATGELKPLSVFVIEAIDTLSIAFEHVATVWVVLAEQVEWIDRGKSRKHRQGKVSRKQRRKIIAQSANRHTTGNFSGLYAGPAGKVRGGLDQEPVLAVGADGKTRLGARPHARIARPAAQPWT